MRFGMTIACGALVAMAILASTAMGEGISLCKVNEDPCAEKNQVSSVHLVAGTIVLKTSILTVLCLSALAVIDNGVFGPTLVSGSFPIHYVTQSLTFSNCGSNAAHNNCAVQNLSTIGLVDLSKTAANLGSASALRAEVLVNCSGFLHCVYGSTVGPILVEGSGHNGAFGNGMFTFTELSIPKVSGFLCPATSNLTALFEPLEDIFVSS